MDELGLDKLDRQILETIIGAGGGPVGIETIASAIGEKRGVTLEDVNEPFLIPVRPHVPLPAEGRMVTARI